MLQAWLDPDAPTALIGVGLLLILGLAVLRVASFSGYFAPHPGPGSSRLTSIWEPIPEAITLTKGTEGAPWTRLDHMLITEPITVAEGTCSLIKLGLRSCWFPRWDVHLREGWSSVSLISGEIGRVFSVCWLLGCFFFS